MSAIPPEISAALSKSLRAQDLLVKSTPGLDNAIANSKKQGLPDIAVAPAQGQALSILLKAIDAKNVLEIGTLGGYSTIWFAGANAGVKVTSLEVNPRHRDVALVSVKAAGREGDVEIILGAALDVLPSLAEQGKVFDFVFIDANWEDQARYFDWAVQLTRKRGIIYVDNAVRQITESDEDDPTAWALVEFAARDRRVEASLVPTLNTHKKVLSGIADGYLLATVL